MGRDLIGFLFQIVLLDFNPRAPHGARRQYHMCQFSTAGFQSTRPAWGATRHALRRVGQRQDFNPRAPHGARRPLNDSGHYEVLISIHAPRMGRDPKRVPANSMEAGFQSTRPAWGATSVALQNNTVRKIFQSTRPAWGATDTFCF